MDYKTSRQSDRGVQREYERIGSHRKKILDPRGSFHRKWNKIFVVACLVAVSLDPLFFYIAEIDRKEKCITLDKNLEIVACVLRTFIDIFYLLKIIFQFHTGFIASSSLVFGRGEVVDDPLVIAKRYLLTYFIVDVLSILPLPQLVVLVVIPKMKLPLPMIAREMMKIVIICQYVLRLVRIVPLFIEVTRTSGILTETASAGAVLNLFLYMLASHLVGALWYFLSLERLDTCWRNVFKKQKWDPRYVYCSQKSHNNYGFPDVNSVKALFNTSCPFIDPDDVSGTFSFGIFTDALKSGVVETTDFSSKFFYCFWWGLRNLSSLGQNLKTSTSAGEIFFAVWIAIFGLILFSLLIGNMQKYLQRYFHSITERQKVEELQEKMQDVERWMSHWILPDLLKERIRRHEQYQWQQTRGIDEETLLRTLPKDLRRDVKRHLGLPLIRRVPMFENMDEQLSDALLDRLKLVLYTEASSIVREGDPVDEMLFIVRGCLATMTTNGGKTNYLKAGDFYGDELLAWALDPKSASNRPTSTWTVKAKTEVEALALMADDFKFVASQFRWLDGKQFRHTIRFYSLQWRTWAACFIQAAWRRHCKRKLDKSLREAEDMMPLLPQKPAEPDFTAEHR